MSENKKKAALIAAFIALMLIPPLVVFAAVYSSVRTNSFNKGSVETLIVEGSHSGASMENSGYSFSEANGEYVVSKPVQIRVPQNSDDQYLRVCPVPMWIDESGKILGSPDISDFKEIELNQDETALLFCAVHGGGTVEPMVTLMLNADWKDHWRYDADRHCFYSRSIVNTGITTPTLIEGVKLSSDVYNNTEGLTLRVEVLTDAVQTTDHNWLSSS